MTATWADAGRRRASGPAAPPHLNAPRPRRGADAGEFAPEPARPHGSDNRGYVNEGAADTAGHVWTIPATRMKVNHEHEVPLNGRAVEIPRVR